MGYGLRDGKSETHREGTERERERRVKKGRAEHKEEERVGRGKRKSGNEMEV